MKNKLQLRPQVSNKLGVKQTVLYAVAGLSLFALLFVGAFFYFNLGNSEEARAGNPGYTSKKNHQGRWSDPNTWIIEGNGWPTASTPQRGEGGITIDIKGVVTDDNPPSSNFFNGSLINVQDTLIIKGNLVITGGRGIDVFSKGILIVFGNVTLTRGAHINNNGNVVITGNLMASGGVRINNNSNGFYLYGNYDPNPNENLYHGNARKDQVRLKNDYENYPPHENLFDYVGNGGITPLPIVLDHFNASSTAHNTVQIAWGTFSEKNNDFFTLERSTDGKNFEVLTTIDGAGNSNKKLHYSFEDINPLPGYNYYRLKQTDYNGDFEYFNIVGVHNKVGTSEIEAKEAIRIGKVWPNPFKDQVNISFEAAMDGEVEVIVQNALGEIVHKAFSPFHYGENAYTFESGTALKAGVYYITLWQNGKKHTTQRLVKL